MPPATRRSPLALIFLTVFIDLVGFGIVIPVLPLYAERFGASPLVIGLLLGVYSFMQFLCAPLLGKLSDRIGRRPVLIASLFGTAAGFLLMGLAKTLALLFVARVIDGATGGNLSTAQAYIADVTPPERRSRSMGLIGAAFGLGFIFGPAIGGLLSRLSPAAPVFFAAVLALANTLAVAIFLPESLPAERRQRARARTSFATLFHGRVGISLGGVLVVYFLTTVAFSLLTAIYPLFTERRFGYDALHNGAIFAGQGVLSAVVQGALLGRLLRIFKEKGLAVAGAILLAAGMFALPVGHSLALLLAATAAVAVGHGLMAAPLNGLASKCADETAQGRALGVMQSAASLARIVGPVLGGWLLHYDAMTQTVHFGRTPFWTSGAILVMAGVLALAL